MADPQQPQIRISLDDAIAEGRYVNFANIIHSAAEFVIDVGSILPGRPDAKVVSRLIMSPLHAKQFVQALQQNITMFEAKFGEIRVEQLADTPIPERSN